MGNKTLDERGFVFIDENSRPFWVCLYEETPFMFYWHPDGKWVTYRQVSQGDVWQFSHKKLTNDQADLYHQHHLNRGYYLPFEIKVQTCRECGCTDNDCSQCVEATGQPCHWVEADLCSRCKDELDAEAAFAAGDFRIPGAEAARPLDLTGPYGPEVE